jgi:hypothetical protein
MLRVFGRLAAIAWESFSFKYDICSFLLKPTTSMRIYRDELKNAIQAAELA